jgi:hypothetical protein
MAQGKLSDEERDRKLIEGLLLLKSDKYEIWKYFEDRAERITERLWSTGTWLISLLAAIISLPFIAKFILVQPIGFPIKVINPIVVILISFFGISSCIFSYFTLVDMKEHIIRNLRRSNYVRTDIWYKLTLKGRKKSAWNIIFSIGVLSLICFICFIFLAFFT